MSADTTNTDWMTEDALAHALGVDRAIVRKHRPNAPTGGVRLNGKAIEWSAVAASTLALTLALPDTQFQKKAAPAATGEESAKKIAAADGVEELTVSSSPMAHGKHFGNPYLIKAKRADGEEVTVKVMNSEKYRPTLLDAMCRDTKEPMVIKARRSVGGNWWELMSREPRWRGRF